MCEQQHNDQVSIKTNNVNIASLRPDIWRETQGDTSQQKRDQGGMTKTEPPVIPLAAILAQP